MTKKTMLAATLTHYRQNDLKLTQTSIPTIGQHDVLVKVRAASINPIDAKTMAGKMRFILSYKLPLIMGSDFAGEIVAVGSRVNKFKVGDAVYGRPRKSRIGTFADYFAINADEIALKPKNLSYTEAAAIPLVGLTSYQVLHDVMAIQPGQKVLIQAGAGGIGTFAIQLAKQLGAFVTTTTSAAHQQLVRDLGADQVIDYHQINFADVLNHYDAVFDTLGGQNLVQAFDIIKPGGHVVSISGMPTAKFAKMAGLPYWKQLVLSLASRQLMRRARQTKSHYEFLLMKPSGVELAKLTEMIEQKRLQPIIDRVFPFEAISEALAYSQQGHATGKIIVQMPI
ncbi:NADPH:quinone reductase [Lactobacillus koreensis] [Lactiplantibacillus mudanjiangensis]|uniref:NADPH:quinone reductase [Lactobacillus koreensis] n=2 Tax=Lactiplantibacillus mudanjiangensis TaxID=1296538 RepID=A0A660DZE7_9LACO|nr:NADP-dependent oxidoreductase [Lactiplantibacillus mudanjiangensis]VDG23355.1 NADPH:quinone reductase [Lactobacillus koreensis] [Lactiplantibacillus mudanjiangensis]VDG28762.1 NADPH:quinone reductase [Lactobacillus koreensis] [Lactiplantibacillus mudanjiangensis]VDG30974.1 NADPH:quinone reductase [Lactobacillus koreensis] [Lactiplantibacillus mudanjiangensis]